MAFPRHLGLPGVLPELQKSISSPRLIRATYRSHVSKGYRAGTEALRPREWTAVLRHAVMGRYTCEQTAFPHGTYRYITLYIQALGNPQTLQL